MTEDDTVNIGSEILERASQEMIAAGISAAAVPHVMVCYGTMLIFCLCPECGAEQIQAVREGIEELWANLTREELN
jgi:hypothetical protein